MTDIQAWLDQGRTLADQAADHVGRLSSGEDRWTMTVPPKDTDSDVALISLLDGWLPAALDALQAVHNLHRVAEADLDGGLIEYCVECYDPEDAYDVDTYPCPTVRAIMAAIGDKS